MRCDLCNSTFNDEEPMPHIRILLVALAIVSGASAAESQAPRSLHIVIVQNSLKGPAAAEVLIKAGAAAENIITLDKRASVDDLMSAVNVARHLRFKVGDTLTQDLRAVARPMRQLASTPNREADAYRADLRRTLERLDRGKPEPLKGYGSVKYLDLVTDAWTPTRSKR